MCTELQSPLKKQLVHTFAVASHWILLSCYGGFDQNYHQKYQIILATGRGILVDFWVSDDIESCKFQNLFVFGFPETSQNLMSFRQLLFSFFHRGGPKRKIWKPQKSAKKAPKLKKFVKPAMFGLLADSFGNVWPFSWLI